MLSILPTSIKADTPSQDEVIGIYLLQGNNTDDQYDSNVSLGNIVSHSIYALMESYGFNVRYVYGASDLGGIEYLIWGNHPAIPGDFVHSTHEWVENSGGVLIWVGVSCYKNYSDFASISWTNNATVGWVQDLHNLTGSCRLYTNNAYVGIGWQGPGNGPLGDGTILDDYDPNGNLSMLKATENEPPTGGVTYWTQWNGNNFAIDSDLVIHARFMNTDGQALDKSCAIGVNTWGSGTIWLLEAFQPNRTLLNSAKNLIVADSVLIDYINLICGTESSVKRTNWYFGAPSSVINMDDLTAMNLTKMYNTVNITEEIFGVYSKFSNLLNSKYFTQDHAWNKMGSTLLAYINWSKERGYSFYDHGDEHHDMSGWTYAQFLNFIGTSKDNFTTYVGKAPEGWTTPGLGIRGDIIGVLDELGYKWHKDIPSQGWLGITALPWVWRVYPSMSLYQFSFNLPDYFRANLESEDLYPSLLGAQENLLTHEIGIDNAIIRGEPLVMHSHQICNYSDDTWEDFLALFSDQGCHPMNFDQYYRWTDSVYDIAFSSTDSAGAYIIEISEVLDGLTFKLSSEPDSVTFVCGSDEYEGVIIEKDMKQYQKKIYYAVLSLSTKEVNLNTELGYYPYGGFERLNYWHTIGTEKNINFSMSGFEKGLQINITEWGDDKEFTISNVDNGTELSFMIWGLVAGDSYSIRVDSVTVDSFEAVDAGGYLNFTYSGDWSSHEFIITTSFIEGIMSILWVMLPILMIVGIVSVVMIRRS